ncbi:hematopoietic progenitor cell antigen CD34 [Sphaerodactylus townsendi]|uniref:hematopoietic progenitor cell antigen CD34 n=1 Tax=Sphaerodactylus townsendi TaxID=933632 RepID=UPI0020273EB2|nr:hematopoietic progenitor cell antigen CD34 [Sphaerodactylus townsendi]
MSGMRCRTVGARRAHDSNGRSIWRLSIYLVSEKMFYLGQDWGPSDHSQSWATNIAPERARILVFENPTAVVVRFGKTHLEAVTLLNNRSHHLGIIDVYEVGAFRNLARKRRQFFWTAFCVLSLLEDQVSGDGTTSSLTISSSRISPSKLSITEGSTTTASSLATEASTASKRSSQTPKEISDVTTSPSDSPSAENITFATQLPVADNTTSNVSKETTTSPLTSPTVLQNASATDPPNNFSDSPTTAQAGTSSMMGNITCLNIKQVTASHVICLKLNESYSCQEFRQKKGEHFKKVICEKKSNQCDIKLADSELHKECLLLVEINKKGADVLDAVLQKQTTLTELGIQYEKHGIENHKSYTRKTLIALVTAGLLLAFLGLAGYCLMKRRSWSPMGERLGEDPYYTEHGSHGNTVISVTPHEQSDLQDKPNLNGGARENGTGQPTSKNGQSCKPHVVADTEL